MTDTATNPPEANGRGVADASLSNPTRPPNYPAPESAATDR
jgi:hypothetical protein